MAFIPSDLLVEACSAIAQAMGLEGQTAGGGGSGQGRKRKARGEGGGGGGSGDGKDASAAARRAVLERLGLLPPNVVVVPAERPLSDELLSVAQVAAWA